MKQKIENFFANPRMVGLLVLAVIATFLAIISPPTFIAVAITLAVLGGIVYLGVSMIDGVRFKF